MTTEHIDDDSPCLGPEDLARPAGLTLRQLTAAIRAGKVPPPDLELSRRLRRWKRSTVAAWLAGAWKPAGKGVSDAQA